MPGVASIKVSYDKNKGALWLPVREIAGRGG